MTIKPINYNLNFEPGFKKFIFEGKEKLTFEVKKELNKIVLDMAELKITSYELRIKGKNIISSIRIDNENEKLNIFLSENLKPGTYTLLLNFEGILNDKLSGFYRSKFVVNGKEKYLATTQFEAADARRAFPCVDHPSYKATFDISIVHDKYQTAISNTLPITTGSVIKEKKVTKFETTPLMSTYLLYLGIGQFEFIQDKYNDVLLRVVTAPGKSQYGEFALEVTKKVLGYFEEFFNYSYPLRKLDLIAIPDFASGAMENWGAITFRENALLYYPNISSKATKQRIAEIVAHELVHMWFGDLVTMKWWDDLWLNESFATYLANKSLAKFWPEWKIWQQYVSGTVFAGMALDSLKSSHPIKVNVHNTSELDELFDEIAYEKGGSILRMLDNSLGENLFRQGLRKYIKNFSYKNADANDLWQALETNSEFPVHKIMGDFITQVGFPEVKVDYQNNLMNLTQKRFLLKKNKENTTTWNILLNVKGVKKTYSRILFNKIQNKLNPGKIDVININSNYSGFFITNYSKELLEKLLVKHDELTEIDKLGIIHDLFLLTLSGDKKLSDFFYFINKYFEKENSTIILQYLISKLTAINLMISDKVSEKIAVEFSRKALNSVGLIPKKNENILNSYLRTVAISALTLFKDEKTEEFVIGKFMEYLKNEKSLHPDLRSVIYGSAVWFDDRNFPVIMKSYETSNIQEEKAKLLMSLGMSQNKKQIREILTYSLSVKVPLAFLPYAIGSVARNPSAKKEVLNWLFESWDLLLSKTGGLGNMMIRRLLQAIIPINGIGRDKEVIKFFKKRRVKGLERSINQALEELRVNSKFVKKNKFSSS